MPSKITLTLVPCPIGPGYRYLAAFIGTEDHGPYGSGANPTDAVNDLVDVAELMIREMAGDKAA